MDLDREKGDIGKRLLAARLRAGVSEDDAAEAAEVPVPALRMWEKGKSLPCLVQFKALVARYGGTGYAILFGANPFEMTRAEAKELSAASRQFSPSLQVRVSVLLALLAKGHADNAKSSEWGEPTVF